MHPGVPLSCSLVLLTVIIVPSAYGPCHLTAAGAAPSSTACSPTSLLCVIGWSPEALAVADLTDDEVRSIRDQLRAMQPTIEEIQAARRRLAEKRNAVPGPSERASDVVPSIDDIEARVAACRNTLVTGLSDSAAASLQRWTETAGYDVDSKYRTLVLSQADWRRLTSALATVSTCRKTGDPVPAETEAWLAELNSRPTVIQAEQRLRTRTAAVRQSLQ